MMKLQLMLVAVVSFSIEHKLISYLSRGRFSCLVLLVLTALVSPAAAVDTDGDGLLDLMDVPGFNPNATGTGDFYDRGIEDLARIMELVGLKVHISVPLQGQD